jgi:tagaturonate reductase
LTQLSRKLFDRPLRPVQILQFGEGNFLRAFVDNFLQVLNDQQLIDMNVAVVQPVPLGRVRELEAQDGLYTLFLEGVQNQQIVKSHQIIDVLSDFIDPYTQLEKYLDYARNPELKIIFSNTTEAGIVFVPETIAFDQTPESFPGKLLQFLYARYLHFQGDPAKALDIVACELIDDNGEMLCQTLSEQAKHNGMDAEFFHWLVRENRYYNTLVDRIVPGYPKVEANELEQSLGYLDHSMVKGEIFHLWVIEGPDHLKKLLPFQDSGLEVFYVDSIKPYKQRKVKILNGTHTAMVPLSYLSGKRAVKESIEDEAIRAFVERFLFQDVVPTIPLPEADMKKFAMSVFERFQNPFIHHLLMSIALNSVSKYKSRILPSVVDSLSKNHFPNAALFALAALIVFYRGVDEQQAPIALSDESRFLDLFRHLWVTNNVQHVVKSVLEHPFWETSVFSRRDVIAYVTDCTQRIVSHGIQEALQHLLKG